MPHRPVTRPRSSSGKPDPEAFARGHAQETFTLANGFTYVEYYLSRGMDINAFAPNLSFFFSNGMDPEYAVMGRVARRLWAKALKHRYGADERSQMPGCLCGPRTAGTSDDPCARQGATREATATGS